MSISHVFVFFKNSMHMLGCFLLIGVLAGCAGTLSRVQTWDGEAPDGGVALLKTSGEIRVTTVNDNSVTNFLLDDLALDYELLPGNNRIVFIYRSIWAKTRKTEDHESPVHVVTSEPQVLTVEARAGETYQLTASHKPDNRREAQVFAAAPEINLLDASGAVLATARPLADGAPGQAESRMEVAGSGEGAEEGALQRLKALWKQATAAERQEFLGWALD